MGIENDEKLNMLFERRDISENRKRTYLLVFNEIYELLGKTPSELIKEAKKQQKPDWIKQEFLDIDERNISIYFSKYHIYLKNTRKNSKGTINLKMVTFESFYREFNIELPKTPEKKNKIPRVRKKDIPSWEDVELALKKVESLKNKAIILFILTSGLRGGDTSKLTIGDFLEATEKFHNGTLEDLLKQDHSNIIPSWYIDAEKTSRRGNLCITFNTPEAVEAIFNYLEQRIDKGYSVDVDTALFRSDHSINNHFLNSDSIGRIFRTINKKIFNAAEDNLGRVFFRAQNLRKLFISTCSANLPKAMFAVEESSTRVKELDYLAVLAGHKPSKGDMTISYDAIEPEDIEPYYLQLTKYLSIGKVEPKDIKSADYIEMQNKLNKMETIVNKHDTIIKKAETEAEKEELINQIVDDDNLIGILNSIHHEGEGIDVKNIDFLREVVRLKKEEDLSKWKDEKIKKAIYKIIDKVKPIDSTRKLMNSLGKIKYKKDKNGSEKDKDSLALFLNTLDTPFIKKKKDNS